MPSWFVGWGENDSCDHQIEQTNKMFVIYHVSLCITVSSPLLLSYLCTYHSLLSYSNDASAFHRFQSHLMQSAPAVSQMIWHKSACHSKYSHHTPKNVIAGKEMKWKNCLNFINDPIAKPVHKFHLRKDKQIEYKLILISTFIHKP